MNFFHLKLGKNLKITRKFSKKNKSKDYFLKIKEKVETDQNKIEGIFDRDWYALNYPDVIKDGQDPIYHYLVHGHLESRNPGPNFDTNFYKNTYPDIEREDFNPLIHYIDHGRAEGRLTNAYALTPNGPRKVRHVIVKELALKHGEEASLLVTHAPAGRLKPHVLPYMKQLSAAGLKVLLVVIVDRPLELLEMELEFADGVIVRDNAGYDFGAWAHAFQLSPTLYGAGLLVVTNDSVIPTNDTNTFSAMMEKVRSCPSDIVGLTASHEYGWHVQSYFLALKPRALSSWAFQHFMRDMPLIDDKDQVIKAYEIPFANRMKAAGFTVSTIFSGLYSANPTFFSWRELIEQGFPFIKLLMLRKKFYLDTDQHEMLEEVQNDWPEVVKKAGFDVDLVRASLRAAEISALPPGGADTLMVDGGPYDAISRDHPLKVAYFGPWNYENGLGSASREMICVLRHMDVQLNCYPVMKPFHIHRLICPPVETKDFHGRPDIAIVHLNPDSWNVLTDEQREIIRSAKTRVGYWVWETDTIPAAWQQELYSVDRIWAPSAYCADVFTMQTGLPVDVVHHPVRLPAHLSATRESVLRRFGIDPGHRVILYIFDGASYLVRKNPEALIRAFAASKLAEQGWILLLKTKHLHDRPDAANTLIALAERTPGVRIVEVALYADEVSSLLAAADIYASPHCSEGFGLTVAEAMAVGVPVVVTDYAGTRDFVEDGCGYPVPAHGWALEQDHGHYLAGHGWAKIDEDALAITLERAARAVVDGDDAVSQAGKAKIADLLSYETIAKAIGASFENLIGDSRNPAEGFARPIPFHAPAIPETKIDFSSSRRFDEFVGKDGLVTVPINEDMSWDGGPIAEGSATDWLLFAPRNAYVSPDARHFILSSSTRRPDVVLFYADDVALGEDALDRIRLKPEFDRTLFVAQDYIGAPVAVRRKTYEEIGGLDRSRGTAVLYDLILRIAGSGGAISRITKVLLGFDGRRPVADRNARRASLEARTEFAGIDLIDHDGVPDMLIQRRNFSTASTPAVTIIIPTRQTLRPGTQETYVAGLLEQLAKTQWPMDKLTVLVGDDIAGEPEWAKQAWPFRFRRVETIRDPAERFNYAAKMNGLWRISDDEQIVFMNDDATPDNAHWLGALLGFAVDQSVGGVGGRLHYANGSIQHAGMFPTLRTIAHAWLGWPENARTYQHWAVAQREWSVVTGAVFATRRSILSQVNGFDERFSLEFNDVDLCLRIRNLGYRIVYNPDAQFTHVEKASRGSGNPPGEEVALFLSRWSRWLDNDPASHPDMSRNRMDLVAIPEDGSWYVRRS